MTRLERKEQELAKLYEYRQLAMAQNNFYGLQKSQEKIDALNKEIEDARRYNAMRLSDVMKDKSEEVKNDIYKHLLKISLAADFVNECCEQTKEAMRSVGLNDFTLRSEVDELCKLTQKIASFVIIPNQNVLTDMITDNSEFIDACDVAADKHLKEKLNL